MRFWKEHVALRVSLILILTVVGLGMVIGGWKMTGQMTGLIIMLVGLVLLIAALAIYNKPFQDERRRCETIAACRASAVPCPPGFVCAPMGRRRETDLDLLLRRLNYE